jgi:hypothetical protein
VSETGGTLHEILAKFMIHLDLLRKLDESLVFGS